MYAEYEYTVHVERVRQLRVDSLVFVWGKDGRRTSDVLSGSAVSGLEIVDTYPAHDFLHCHQKLCYECS